MTARLSPTRSDGLFFIYTERMDFYEKDLEEIIFNAEPQQLEDRGLYTHHTHLLRQFQIGNYGRCDLLGFTRGRWNPVYNFWMPGEITIYELKKDQLSVSAFFQAIRYLRGVISYLEQRDKLHEYNFKIVLIGRETNDFQNKSDLIYLPDIFYSNSEFQTGNTSVEIMTYSFDLNGINFKEYNSYKLTKEGFNE